MDFSAIIKAISSLLSILLAFVSTFASLFGSGLPGVLPVVPPSAEVTEYDPITLPSAVTTTKPTTAQPTSATTTPGSGSGSSSTGTPGTFTLTAYGFGHGVGMSQEGAIAMAKSGSTYVQILEHYYTGASVFTDYSTPATITYGGVSYPIVEFLCKVCKAEIGEGSPEMAIKAQAATAYSFAKFYKFNVKSSQVAMSSSFKYSGTNVEKYVLSFLGMSSYSDTPRAKFVSTDGKNAAITVFGASAAGHTTDAKSVWGNYYSYLVPVTTPEAISSKTVTITKSQMEDYIYDYNIGINLGSDPGQWVSILAHDAALSPSIGYVTSIRVGTKTMNGFDFRCNVINFAIRSHCFTIQYNY